MSLARTAHSTTDVATGPVSGRRKLFGAAAAVVLGSGITAGVAASVADLVPAASDAQMIAIATQYTAVRNAVNTKADLQDEDPLWATYFELRDVIRDWKPTTLEGLVAKARLTMEDATSPAGVEEPGSISTAWAWDVLNGLIHHGGRA